MQIRTLSTAEKTAFQDALKPAYAEFGKLSSLPDAPQQPPKAMKMVRILMEGHEAVARTARSLLPVVEAASDEPTADILVQRLTVHEQAAWMLRSLLER